MNIFDQIKTLRAKKLDLAQQVAKAEDIDALPAIRDDLIKINEELDVLESLRDQMQGQTFPDPADAPSDNGHDANDLLKSNEYMRSFMDALRNMESPETARMSAERYKPLLDALTETGGTPAGSEGGFLLPIDFDNKIWDLRREYQPLADLVTVENVSTLTGWRAQPKKMATAKFKQFAEMSTIPTAEAPEFVKIEYSVKDYGGLIPVSANLLNDTPVNIMNYLSGWMAQLSVNTENDLLLALLKPLTAAAWASGTAGDKPLKAALNKGLDPAISVRAVVLTNQTGFDYMDQMQDGQKRALLQPDATNAALYRIKGRGVRVVSDWVLANISGDEGAPDAVAPVYIGDFKEYMHLFRRQSFELASTNVGAGAFETRSIRVRGSQRLDVQKFDGSAVTALAIS